MLPFVLTCGVVICIKDLEDLSGTVGRVKTRNVGLINRTFRLINLHLSLKSN